MGNLSFPNAPSPNDTYTDDNGNQWTWNGESWIATTPLVVDDSPNDGSNTTPISSNWAYDHVNAADPHTVYLKESDIDDSANNGVTTRPISSNWAYDHEVANTTSGTPPHGLPFSKYDATAEPTANNDSSEGYSVGSVWIDVTNDASYTCVDATEGAAVWSSGGGTSVTIANTAPDGPDAGDMWFSNDEGRLKIYYNDGDSSQWIDAFGYPPVADLVTANGLTPMTGNWDAGSIKITAQQFESDIATGTAPFVVASTTLVDNLNADTVDGIEGAAFLQKDGSVPLTGSWDVGNSVSNVTSIQVDGLANVGSLDVVGAATVGGSNILTESDLANVSLTDAGSNTTTAVTPDSLAGSIFGVRTIAVVMTSRTANCAANTQVDLHVPPSMNGMELYYVHAELSESGTTGTQNMNIQKNGTDMLSTDLTVDSGETGSDTAATAYVIKTDGTEDVATNDKLTFIIDSVQTTPAKGCIITAEFRIP